MRHVLIILFLSTLLCSALPHELPADLKTTKALKIDKPYLIWPVQRQPKGGKPDCRFFISLNDELFTFADVQLATEEPDFWVFTDLSLHQGKTLKIECSIDPKYDASFEKVILADEVPGMEEVYHEKLRPQFHFSSKRGWLNDPNGMTYYDGEWHLFYQHNPYNWHWNNISWGHAVSTDLLHWKELPAAIVPGPEGNIFSGSGTVDHDNDSGFQTGREKVMLAGYTGNGLMSYIPGLNRTQCLAYSNDRGRSWTKITQNPVISNKYNSKDRDPKIFKHKPTGKWVLIYYENSGTYHINTSTDLINWTESGSYKSGGHECPDMFELPIDGDPQNTKWVVWSGNGKYKIGSFDGEKFHEESKILQSYFGQAYAGQTFSDAPDGRVVHIGWLRHDQGGFNAGHRGMPFNQQMTLPMDFTLRSTDDGPRLFIEAIPELSNLRDSIKSFENLTASPGKELLPEIQGDQIEIEAAIKVGDAKSLTFTLRGMPVTYTADTGELSCGGQKAKVSLLDGILYLHMFLDITSVEVFANRGQAYFSRFIVLDEKNHNIRLSAQGGTATVSELHIYGLKSIWK